MGHYADLSNISAELPLQEVRTLSRAELSRPASSSPRGPRGVAALANPNPISNTDSPRIGFSKSSLALRIGASLR
jgi:hypothetical protein